MKKIFKVLTAMAMVGVMAVPARAEQTANLEVSATVAANCTITTEALSFGSYDPIVANKSTALTGSGSVKVTCTNGSPVTITLGQGSNADAGSTDAAPARRMTNGAAFLAYALFSAPEVVWGNTEGTGVADEGTGVEETLTVYGEVAANQNVPTGSYADTVLATVTF